MATSWAPITCDDCKDSVYRFVLLRCSVHSICRKCLTERARTMRAEALECAQCSTPSEAEKTSSDTVPPGIWIFVDDSNVWIEAKKLQSSLKNFKTGEDHRLRIDMGKLASVIARDRYVESGTLYAAEPPPIADVWYNIKNKAGWYVDRSEFRSISCSKGKQIDAKLVADATATAIMTPICQRTTIALVTGDTNVVPALDKIMKQEGWAIEVYMWRQSIAKSLTEFSQDPKHHGRVKIIQLDDYLDEISFIQYKPNREYRLLAKSYGVVFSMQPDAFTESVVPNEWVEKLEAVTRWPLEHYWFSEENEKTNNLVVIFQKDKSTYQKFDLDHFMSESVDHILAMPHMHIVNIQTFREFISKRNIEEPDEDLKMFDEALQQLDYTIDDGTESNSSCTSVDMSGFKPVRRKVPRPKQKYTKWCPFKKNCKNGTNCHSRHSEHDKIYFRKRRSGGGNPQRKTTMCTPYINRKCYKSKEDCEYAHGKDDAWCTNCRNVGHFTSDCEEPRRNKSSVSM